MYVSPRRFVIPDPAPVVVPAGAKEMFATLDAAEQALIVAEVAKLATIHELCLAYHAVDEDAFGEAAERLIYHGAQGTPPVAEFLSLEISALLRISPGAGASLIAQVLNCVYRHPLMWAAVQAGAVRWYRATEVISEVNGSGLCRDAARWVDQRITPRLAGLSRGRALRLLRGLIASADPDQARAREEKARTHRHVTLWDASLESGPCRNLTGRLDVTDALALDATLNQLAAMLAADGDEDTVDQRRASSLGILADPARALALLNGQDSLCHQQATLVVHVDPSTTDSDLAIARIEGHGPLSRETWVGLLGNSQVTVRPIIDLNALPPVDSYEIPDRIRDAVCWRSPADMFPYGTLTSRRCDLDHTEPYDHGATAPPGQTRTGNLSPISRRPHRAKTARAWSVSQYEGGWVEWTSPGGYRYATGPFGTFRQIPADAA